MADEVLSVKVKVDDSDLDQAKKDAKELETLLEKLETGVDIPVKFQGSGGGGMNGLAKAAQQLNIVGAALQNVGNNLQMIGRTGFFASGGVMAGVAGGLTKLTTTAVKSASNIESAFTKLSSQGLSDSELQFTADAIQDFSLKSSFGMADMTDTVSTLNAFVGDIEVATAATELFGTAMMASGGNAEDLANNAKNLGEMYTGSFNKADYTELLTDVPLISQALRDIDVDSWEDFNAALGDDPDTQAFERTANALTDLLIPALNDYLGIVEDLESKGSTSDQMQAIVDAIPDSDIIEKLNSTVAARYDNMKETIGTTLAQEAGVFDYMKNGDTDNLYGSVAESLDNIGEAFSNNEELIGEFFDWVGEKMVAFTEGMIDFDYEGFFEGLTNGINEVKGAFITLGETLNSVFGGDNVGDLIGNIFSGSIKAFSVGTATKIIASLTSFASAIFSIFSNFKGGGAKVPAAPKPEGISKWGQAFSAIGSLSGSILSMTVAIEAMSMLPNSGVITEGFLKISAVAIGMTALNGIVGKMNEFAKLSEEIGQMSEVIDVGVIMALSAGCFALSVLPNIGVITQGFEKIAVVAIGMTALNGIVGMMGAIDGVGEAMGLMATALDVGSIMLLSAGCFALSALPPISTIIMGFVKIAAVAGGMTLLSVAIGAITATPVGITEFLGDAIMILDATTIMMLAKGAQALNDLPDPATIETGFESLTTIAEKMGELSSTVVSNTSMGESLSAWVDTFLEKGTMKHLGQIIEQYVEAAEELKALDDIDVSGYATKIGEIEKIFDKIITQVNNDTSTIDKKGSGDSGSTKGTSKDIKKIVTKYMDAVEALAPLEDIDVSGYSAKIDELNSVLGKIMSTVNANQELDDTKGSVTSTSTSKDIKKIVTKYMDAVAALAPLNELDVSGYSAKIDEINSVLGKILNQMNIAQGSNDVSGDKTTTGTAGDIKSIVTNYMEAVAALAPLNDLDVSGLSAKIDEINIVFGKINTMFGQEMNSSESFVSNLTQASEAIGRFVETLEQALNQLDAVATMAEPKGAAIAEAIIQGFEGASWSTMGTNLQHRLTTIAEYGTTAGERLVANFEGSTSTLGDTALDKIADVKDALVELDGITATPSIEIDTSQAIASINAVNTSLSTMNANADAATRNAISSMQSAKNAANDAPVPVGRGGNTTTNNYYNTNSPTVNQSFGGSGSSQYMRLRRQLRGI
ncbi:MAG: hypothetical protein ACK5LJ_08085 [Paracoccus sp. (in: a-proteobacteria)]